MSEERYWEHEARQEAGRKAAEAVYDMAEEVASLEAENAALKQENERLRDALVELRDAVAANPAMNRMEYDGLGVKINNALLTGGE